ncbi:PTS sugar transporter subunit IIC [Lacticaseibacillus yichunensis]|uniref:PTS sugar transporter subunit IIC n=1 Tax=Lacticaseibacillus yichunensis TaxID=2486015 RepID=A0ABW4CL57_9LACO|nr:PTS sugar transporter subunit IIC [Lacticaseibacillus yichunensis]
MGKIGQRLERTLTRLHQWWRQLSWPAALVVTLRRLRAFLLFAGVLSAITASVFSHNGFFAAVYDLPHRMPGWAPIGHAFAAATPVVWGLLTLAIVGLFTYEVQRRRDIFAPVTAIAVVVLGSMDLSTMRPPTFSDFGSDRLLVSLVIAGLVAWLFDRNWARGVRPRTCLALGATVLAITIGATRHYWQLAVVSSGVITSVANLPGPHVFLFLLPMLNTLLVWCGLPSVLPTLNRFSSSGWSTENLDYALSHAHGLNLPHLLTLMTTYAPFANMGGAGMTLALLCAVVIARRKVPSAAFLPSLVNLPLPALLTLPALLDPVLLIPAIIAPLVVQLLAAGALVLHLFAANVFEVPPTTPGPLIALLGTNGDWRAGIFAVVMLAVATLIFLPFVRIALKEGAAS